MSNQQTYDNTTSLSKKDLLLLQELYLVLDTKPKTNHHGKPIKYSMEAYPSHKKFLDKLTNNQTSFSRILAITYNERVLKSTQCSSFRPYHDKTLNIKNFLNLYLAKPLRIKLNKQCITSGLTEKEGDLLKNTNLAKNELPLNHNKIS